MAKNTKFALLKTAICLLLISFCGAKSFGGLFPPKIIVQPLGISVQNGGTAIIAVAAQTTDILYGPSFTWYCNNKKITQGGNISISSDDSLTLLGINLLGLSPVSILTITGLASANAGSYYVVETDSEGSATSSNAVLVVLSPVVNNAINIISSQTALTAAGFKLQMSTPTGSNVVVQASSDLVHWTPIYTNLNSSGSLSFTDGTATNYPYRYYRARTQ